MPDDKDKEEATRDEESQELSIVVGDFAFDMSKKYGLFMANPIGYERIALKMMTKHYEFYGQLNSVGKVENYVTRESVIACDCGDRDILLDAYVDHGVIGANGKPLMACDDCKVNKNIYSFGLCSPKFPYSRKLPHPSGKKEMNAKGQMCYRCMPILGEKWKQRKSHLLIGDVENEEFIEALKDKAYLVCQYGGIITVEQLAEYELIDSSEFLVTLDDLEEFGFFIGLDDIEKEKGIQELNRILIKYEINTDLRIAAFMGECAKESGKGARTLEKFNGDDPEDYFNKLYKTSVGNCEPGDGQLFRGAGYIHLTGRENYQHFADYIGDQNIMKEGYKVVGGEYNRDIKVIKREDLGVIDIGEYAWEASGWFWKYGNPAGVDLNTYADQEKWDDISLAVNRNGGNLEERKGYILEFLGIWSLNH